MAQKQSFHDIINGEQPVLIDFFAEWCGPCKAMAPVLKEVAGKWNEQVRVIKIDIDKNQLLSSRLQIRGVPTFVLYQKGKVAWRASGMQTAHQLEQAIQSVL
ncbi:MAG: thioredoxin [Bacteroidota bacterium]